MPEHTGRLDDPADHTESCWVPSSSRLPRWTASIATAIALSFTPLAPAPVAQAKRPAAPASLASAAIDAHLGYQAQSTCSPSPKPGTTALLRLLIKTWGGKSSGIYRGCSSGGTSEHKEGRALDWRMSVKSAAQRKRVDQALAWITANNGEVAYRLGVMYIIWNQRIWSIYYPELGWRKMASRGSATANHKDHVHISLSWDGAMKQTSWWTGVPVTQPLNSKCGTNGARACLSTIARRSGSAWPYLASVVPATFLPFPWTKPAIGGSPQVGRTLTAVPGTWVPEGATLSYQWTADDKPILGANQPTYVVTTGEVGKEIRVVVSATSAAGVRTLTSDELAEVYRGRFGNASPVILGTIAPGTTVTADVSGWSPAPTRASYRWLRNGKAIKSATKATYTITGADLGKKLSVRVTAGATGYYDLTATSAATKVAPAFASAPLPTVTGTPVVGGTLTVDAGVWKPTPAQLSLQWLVDGAAIADATGATLALGPELLGRTVAVRVRAELAGVASMSTVSAGVVVAAPAAPEPEVAAPARPVPEVVTPEPEAVTPAPEVAVAEAAADDGDGPS